MSRYVRKAAMVKIGDGKGDYVLVGAGDKVVIDEYLQRPGWEIEEEIPEHVIDTQGAPPPPPFSSKVEPTKTEPGEHPPLPGIDAEHRRKAKKKAAADGDKPAES